jgi:hypothetical protein
MLLPQNLQNRKSFLPTTTTFSHTNSAIAAVLQDRLHHRISLAQLVDWAERAMTDGNFVARDLERIRNVVAHMGVADVRAFGLTWEDCEQFLEELGYFARVEVVPAQPWSASATVREKPAKKYRA